MTRRPTLLRRPLAALLLCAACAGADGPSPPPSSSPAGEAVRHRIAPNRNIGRTPGGTSAGSGGWWSGPAFVAAALAAIGAASVVARRYAPARPPEGTTLKVVGRAALGPRHAVHLLKTGDRIWLIGTGPQGAPSLLGELDDESPPPEPFRTPRPAEAAASAAPRLLTRVTARPGGTA